MPDLNYISLDGLKSGRIQGGSTLVLRHAERYKIHTAEDILNADLTENGYKDACCFGERLAGLVRIGQVFSSPIRRCVHTGQSILEGASAQAPVFQKWWLYSPWLRVDFQRQPDPGDIFIQNKNDAEAYDRDMLRMIVKRIKFPTEPDVANLYIAHDTTILPLVAFLLGLERVSFEEIPGFLEGIALRCQQGKVVLVQA